MIRPIQLLVLTAACSHLYMEKVVLSMKCLFRMILLLRKEACQFIGTLNMMTAQIPKYHRHGTGAVLQ
ncbi:hypothetical protein ES703_111487 [subsurface metagenome]